MVSALEAATALMLEMEFSWDPRPVGVAIFASFLAGVPLSMVAICARRLYAESTGLMRHHSDFGRGYRRNQP